MSKHGDVQEAFYKIPKSVLCADGYYSPRTGKAIKLTASAKLIYTYMIGRLTFFTETQGGDHYESQSTIAEGCGLEYKTVGNILREFLENDVIRGVKLRPGGRGQWRWHYKYINKNLNYWIDVDGKHVAVVKQMIDNSKNKSIFVKSSQSYLNDDFDELPF